MALSLTECNSLLNWEEAQPPERLSVLWERLRATLEPHYEMMGSQFPKVVRESIEAGEWVGTSTQLLLEYCTNFKSIKEFFSE